MCHLLEDTSLRTTDSMFLSRSLLQGPRYSIAYFNQADKSSVIQGPQKKYEPVTGGDFILAAMKRNYDMLEQKKKEQAVAAA